MTQKYLFQSVSQGLTKHLLKLVDSLLAKSSNSGYYFFYRYVYQEKRFISFMTSCNLGGNL